MDFSKFLNKLESSLEVIRSLIGNPYVEIVRKEVEMNSDGNQSNPLLINDSQEMSDRKVGIVNKVIKIKIPCVYTSGSSIVMLDEKKLGEIYKLRVYIKKADVENTELKEIRSNDTVYLNGKEYQIESIKDAYRFYVLSLR